MISPIALVSGTVPYCHFLQFPIFLCALVLGFCYIYMLVTGELSYLLFIPLRNKDEAMKHSGFLLLIYFENFHEFVSFYHAFICDIWLVNIGILSLMSFKFLVY